jgi:signal transduction histidine kinase
MVNTLRKPQNAQVIPASLLAYVADLEMEVDRLRRHIHLVSQEAREAVSRIRQLAVHSTMPDAGPAALAEIGDIVKHVAGVLRDFHEPPGYHPANDQVIAIAVRPLAEQVFRWQQRLQDAPDATCQLDLESEFIEWFPARLRHVLDNLFSNALKYRDPDKVESWVRVELRLSPADYRLRISDNGIGLESGARDQAFDVYCRAAPARAAGLGVGLAVVKALVEHSGGTLSVDSGAGQGTTFLVVLPRYAIDDFLV